MDVDALLNRIADVCPLPATTLRVMSLARSPEATLQQVAEAIEADPALALEVVRLAQSPLMKRGDHPCDLRRATSLLGLDELHDLAAGMALLVAFRSEHELALAIHDASVVMSVYARALARALDADERTCHLGGLLAEVGALACMALDPDYHVLRAENPEPADLVAAECERYGISSRDLGARLLLRNQLPEDVALAVADDPPSELRERRIVGFVRDAVPAILEAGSRNDTDGLEDRLDELAGDYDLPLPGPRLFELAVEAGVIAASLLRRVRLAG